MKKNLFKLNVVSIRLVKEAPIYSEFPLENPEDVISCLGDVMSQFDREVVCIINLKSSLVPINIHFASIGTLNEAMIHPREMIKSSILSNAANIIMLHCHPSGSISPSKQDTMITDRMSQICELIGIPLLDHIIVGGDNSTYFSFAKKKMMPKTSIAFENEYQSLSMEVPKVLGKSR